MGLIAARPETPDEWGGLPSEPRVPEPTAERLDAPVVDVLGAVTGGSITSVSIPLSAPTE